MTDIAVFRQERSRPEPLPPSIDIHDGPTPERPASASAGNYGEALGGNSARNGRCPWPQPVVRVRLETLWKRDFGPGFGIEAMAGVANRVYLHAKLRWSLVDGDNGMTRAGGLRGLGTGSLDGENALLYQPDADGQLQGVHFDRGQPAFWASLFMGNLYNRRFAAHVGDSLFLLGSERPLPAAEAPDAEWSLLEALPIGPKPEVRPSGQLEPGLYNPLLFKHPQVMGAAWSAGIAVLFPGVILLIDDMLRVKAVLKGEFKPIAVSVDEAGWIHLLADEPSGKRALWIVSPQGVRTLHFPLPAPFTHASEPPLITFSRNVIIRGEGALLCVSNSGVIRWSRPVGPNAHPMVTGDNKVLVADGSELVVFEPDGQRSVLHRFDPDELGGDVLALPPLLEEGSVLTVATATRLLRLRPAREHGTRR